MCVLARHRRHAGRKVLDLFGRIWCCLLVLLFDAELRRSEPKAAKMGAAGYSKNKACSGSLSVAAGVLLSSSSRRHGGGRGRIQAELCSLASHCGGVVVLQILDEHSRRPLSWRPTQWTSWWSSSKPAMEAVASSTSIGRPSFELAAASHVLSVPSGFVPGTDEDGRGLSSYCSGECSGLDCVFQNLSKVFLEKVRDLDVILSSFEVPDVTCTCTALY